MDAKNLFSTLTNTILQNLPPTLQACKQEISEYLQTSLSKSFQDLHLVTREEFEIQKSVLARTRQKLIELEAILKTHIQNIN